MNDLKQSTVTLPLRLIGYPVIALSIFFRFVFYPLRFVVSYKCLHWSCAFNSFIESCIEAYYKAAVDKWGYSNADRVGEMMFGDYWTLHDGHFCSLPRCDVVQLGTLLPPDMPPPPENALRARDAMRDILDAVVDDIAKEYGVCIGGGFSVTVPDGGPITHAASCAFNSTAHERATPTAPESGEAR